VTKFIIGGAGKSSDSQETAPEQATVSESTDAEPVFVE